MYYGKLRIAFNGTNCIRHYSALLSFVYPSRFYFLLWFPLLYFFFSSSGRKLTSEGLSTCQGYNWSTDIREIQVSTSTNRAFHNCVDQDSAPSSSAQESQNLTQRNVSSQAASKSRNPIFQYCVGQMQNILENSKTQGFVSNNEQNVVQDQTIGNLSLPQGQNGQISTYHVTERSPNSSTHTNAEFRGGFIEIEMAKLTLPGKRSYPEVTAVPGVCGQPTSPTSTGVRGPLLAGVGRARLLAEARKNNFGGICNSPPKVTGNSFVCSFVRVIDRSLVRLIALKNSESVTNLKVKLCLLSPKRFQFAFNLTAQYTYCFLFSSLRFFSWL